MKILHIITSLEHGGAQLLASNLIINTNDLHKHFVFVLFDKGPYKSILTREGVEVMSSQSSSIFTILPTLFSYYKKIRPNIVHTWMYHADFIGLIISLIFKNHKLLWSIHHADPKQNKLATRLIILVCKIFSKFLPIKIIACSKLARDNHVNYGYSNKNMIVINNGINFENFLNTRSSDKQYNFDKNNIVIGHIARWHSIKGHKYFLEMASNLYKNNNNFSFILVGTGINWSNKELYDLLVFYDLIDAVQLLGEQENISQVLNSFDIYVSSSINESFSLTLIEAIACRVLSISSDTGIARDALSDDLCIFGVGESIQLTEKVNSLISMPPNKIKKIVDDSYLKIHDKFDERIMFDNYRNVYESF